MSRISSIAGGWMKNSQLPGSAYCSRSSAVNHSGSGTWPLIIAIQWFDGGAFVSMITPAQVQPPLRTEGKRRQRELAMSMIDLSTSLASFTQTPVMFSDFSFLTSSGRSSARKMISRSITPAASSTWK